MSAVNYDWVQGDRGLLADTLNNWPVTRVNNSPDKHVFRVEVEPQNSTQECLKSESNPPPSGCEAPRCRLQ